ncbi:MAG: ubiquitin-like protein Pup [Actinobacteria bacterium]|nr:ubiquitin-like protein Pup [Actinomycetota bacterium]
MASGEQSRKPKPKQDEEQSQADEKKAETTSTQEIDDLLDEIDSVLEENSEEFVRAFVQKGGQVIVLVAFYISFVSQQIS